MSPKVLVLKEALVRFTAVVEQSIKKERKLNWMNIARGSTLKPVGC
jgi:hypothetical protein